MGGPSSTQQQAENLQLSTAQQQQQLESQYATMAQNIIQYGQNLQQPLVQQDVALTSGNPTAVLQAAGPQLGQIAQAGTAAQENIYNNVAPGAGRDFALSQVPQQTYSQSASYLNSLVNNAYGQLAQLGTGQLGLGVQQEAAGQGAGSLSTTAAGNVATTEAQSKSGTLGFLGSLAGAAAQGAGIGAGIAAG